MQGRVKRACPTLSLSGELSYATSHICITRSGFRFTLSHRDSEKQRNLQTPNTPSNGAELGDNRLIFFIKIEIAFRIRSESGKPVLRTASVLKIAFPRNLKYHIIIWNLEMRPSQ